MKVSVLGKMFMTLSKTLLQKCELSIDFLSEVLHFNEHLTHFLHLLGPILLQIGLFLQAQ